MKKAVKTFALSAMSVALLSGCVLEDKYDGPGSSGSNAVDATFNIYGMAGSVLGNDERFAIKSLDSTGYAEAVNEQGIASGVNINITPENTNWETDGPLNVKIEGLEDDKEAALIAQGEGNFDYSYASPNGTLRLTIDPQTMTPFSADEGFVFVEVPSSGEPAILDITSAYNSFVGASKPQLLKIPTSCFADTAFSDGSTPFKIISKADTEFVFSVAQMRANTDHELYVYDCSVGNDSVVLNQAVSHAFFVELNGEKLEPKGWARNVRGMNITDTGKNEPATITDNEGQPLHGQRIVAGSNKAVGVNFGIPANDNVKDISRYVGAGTLDFNLTVEELAGHTGGFEVRMAYDLGGDNEIQSKPYTIEAEDFVEGQVTEISIPLNKLLAEPAGQNRVDFNLVRTLDRALIIQTKGATDPIDGMTFHISNVNLVMN